MDSITYEIKNFFEPIGTFFVNIWTNIQDFFLQYMPQNVFNLFCIVIILFVILITILAIMNHK